MENIFDVGKVPYEAAPPLKKPSFGEVLTIVLETAYDIIKILLISVPSWIDAFIHLFISRPKKNVAGQVALVTGGGNGIGKSIALRLAQEGCHIAIVDIDRDAGFQTAKEINLLNVKAKAYHLDITDYNGVKNLLAQIENDLGSVDILVNNAALIPVLSLREGTVQEVQRLVDVNITAHFIMTRTFLPGMLRSRRGHIVTISSITSFHPVPGAIIYSASKFALQGFAEALSEELRQEGYGDCIHHTSVHPYFVSTRRDLMEAVKLRFWALTSEDTANVTVDGILRNQMHVTIPAMDRWFSAFVRWLPYKIQHLVRDHLLRENQGQVFLKRKQNE